MEFKSSNCINCGATVTAPFCSNCAQPHPPKKLNLLTLSTNLQSAVVGFDALFPRTFADLTTRPGKVSRDYIDGNRIKYVGPVSYFFLALATLLLVMEILNVDLYSLSHSSMPFGMENSRGQEKAEKLYFDFMVKYIRILSFLLIPLNVMVALLFFRKEKINFIEHSVLVFYVNGHATWITVLNVFIYKFFGTSFNTVQLILNILLYGIGCTTLYAENSRVTLFVKGALVMLISFVIYILFIGAAGLLYIINDPGALNELRNSRPK